MGEKAELEQAPEENSRIAFVLISISILLVLLVAAIYFMVRKLKLCCFQQKRKHGIKDGTFKGEKHNEVEKFDESETYEDPKHANASLLSVDE